MIMKPPQEELKSECCFSPPLGPTNYIGKFHGVVDQDTYIGFCSRCKDNAVFHSVEFYKKEENKEFINGT